MTNRRWPWGVGVLWVSALLFANCSDDSTPSSENVGGDASRAEGGGAGTLSHPDGGSASAGRDGTPSAGAGGEGGATLLLEACGPYPLSDLCHDHPASCPDSPDQISPDECLFSEVKRYASSCGGTVVQSVSVPQSITTWSFDAADHLTGVVTTGDVGAPCKEGGYSFTVVYGEPCEASGEGELLCSGAGGAGGSGGAGGAGGGP